jgi:hypothetical protein
MKKALSTLPAFVTGGLGLCPACIPLYAGILSAFGISTTGYTAYAIWLIPIMVLISLGTLFYKARQRRGYAPFALGFLSSAGLLMGKFILANDMIFYISVAGLILSSIWNIWPQHKGCDSCPSDANIKID